MRKSYQLARALFHCLLVYGCWLLGNSDHHWAHSSVAAAPNQEPQQDVIVGQVWKDMNWNGVQQIGDPFIPYVLVTLYRLAPAPEQPVTQGSTLTATPLLTTTTTITGWYQFTNLAAGSYYLDFVTPGRMTPTWSDQGADETTDSDIVATGVGLAGRSAPITLANTGQIVNIDAGFVATAQLTVYVYEDTNHDQKRQMGESALMGAVVVLSTSPENATARKEISRLVVDDKGAAKFADLAPGRYTIEVWPPDGYTVHGVDALTRLTVQPGTTLRMEAPILLAPKLVDLVNFTAEVKENALVVRWLTAAEQETYGYRLLRQARVAAADTVHFMSDLIPSQGIFGGAYELQLAYNPVYDAPYETMIFWLIEYEVNGAQNRYGPISVAPPLATRSFLPLITR